MLRSRSDSRAPLRHSGACTSARIVLGNAMYHHIPQLHARLRKKRFCSKLPHLFKMTLPCALGIGLNSIEFGKRLAKFSF